MKILPTLGPMSGSVGGTTYSHNKGGQYARLRSMPVNPQSAAQLKARQALSTLSSQWSGLDEGQRAAWNYWAAVNPVTDSLGQSVQLTGHQAFISLNARLLQAGASANTAPPSSSGPAALQISSATPSSVTQDITVLLTGAVPAGGRLIAWVAAPLTPGKDPAFSQAKILEYTAADPTGPFSFDLPANVQDGDYINLWIQVMDSNGQVAPPAKAREVMAP